jgi:hypothetical protein
VRVDPITLKALLVVEALAADSSGTSILCDAGCSIVYFDSAVTFTEADVSVPVYAKHTSARTCRSVTAFSSRGESFAPKRIVKVRNPPRAESEKCRREGGPLRL